MSPDSSISPRNVQCSDSSVPDVQCSGLYPCFDVQCSGLHAAGSAQCSSAVQCASIDAQCPLEAQCSGGSPWASAQCSLAAQCSSFARAGVQCSLEVQCSGLSRANVQCSLDAQCSNLARADIQCSLDVQCSGLSSLTEAQCSLDAQCSGPAVLDRASAVPILANWRPAAELYRAPLPDAHELVFHSLAPLGPVVLSEPARTALDSFVSPRALDSLLAWQLARVGLLVPVDAADPVLCSASTGEVLSVWLHVTNDCNLRCSYCYVDKNSETMDEATGQAALRTLFHTAGRHGFKALHIKYAGGEPTLGLDLVGALHDYATLLSEQYGLALHETLISNGVHLSAEALSFIQSAGIYLAISLDPSRAAHDSRRTWPDGRGTFDQVCHSVELAVRQGLSPSLLITLAGTEDEQSAEAVELALEHGLPFHLNFVRPAHVQSLVAMQGLIASAEAALARVEARLPRYSLLSVLDRADFSRPHRHSCGAGLCYLAVDQHGSFSACQMELSRPAAELGVTDPLAVVGEKFVNPDVHERAGCASCTWRYACAGGCPRMARPLGVGAMMPSPYCSAYRILYPKLLRLEGLRLLQQGSGC